MDLPALPLPTYFSPLSQTILFSRHEQPLSSSSPSFRMGLVPVLVFLSERSLHLDHSFLFSHPVIGIHANVNLGAPQQQGPAAQEEGRRGGRPQRMTIPTLCFFRKAHFHSAIHPTSSRCSRSERGDRGCCCCSRCRCRHQLCKSIPPLSEAPFKSP